LSYDGCLHLYDGQSFHCFILCNDFHCCTDCDFSVDCDSVLDLSFDPCVDCLSCVPSSLDSQGCHSSWLNHWCCLCSYMCCSWYTSSAKLGHISWVSQKVDHLSNIDWEVLEGKVSNHRVLWVIVWNLQNVGRLDGFLAFMIKSRRSSAVLEVPPHFWMNIRR
jgi:hypothetical protein